MPTLYFHTTINCASCVRAVTPALEKLAPATWAVDTNEANKPLTVKGENVSAQQVVDTLAAVGFSATLVQEEA
ncbi:heavy-metal-associated domain-containing protein [Eisenibacter elegans]|jgi:copper chaperone CopZ|uniref:heavy-metal-associated domain-containing protein n=1 Tax=Eisenibacter elegans TaxID=997 RepID=UPI000426A9E2|nr:hypothetical protein [Eisenibacter elegans]